MLVHAKTRISGHKIQVGTQSTAALFRKLGLKDPGRDGCKTPQEVNFQRGDMLCMLKPLSWCHHVASRTRVLRV